jgi:vanillate O-demethylase monooxygenase subunit
MKILKNSWYCAGWSGEFDAKPVGKTILGEYLVFYRDAEGHAVAMTGRCPHRFAPLDRGIVTPQGLMCPYHGLVFNDSGACVANPFGGGQIPDRAKLRRYPVAENDGVVWVWMGAAKLADASGPPQVAWLSDPSFVITRAYLKVDVNYQLVVDNLLDLTHVPLVHADTLSKGLDEAPEIQHKFSTEGDIVHSDYFLPNSTPQEVFGDMFKGRGDFSANMTWRPGSTLSLETFFVPPADAGEQTAYINTLHYLAPETENSTHYFVALGRNMRIDDEAESQRILNIVMKAFSQEDEPMMRACAGLMAGADLFDLNPAILKTDVAAVQARRILAKLIKAEQASAAQVTA